MDNLILLRPVSDADLPILNRWDTDPIIAGLMGRRFDLRPAEEWLSSLRRSGLARAWMIERDGRTIGEVELAQINHRSGTAELRICIGEESFRGQGLGRAALAATLAIAFGALRLQRVYLRVFETNERAIRLYESMGFRREAVLSPSERRQDPAPVVLMTLPRHRWEAQQRQAGAVGSA